jgi:hypothetical protein
MISYSRGGLKMSNLYSEIFKDKSRNEYTLTFYEDEGGPQWKNGKDFFKGTISVYKNANSKKDIEIWLSMTLVTAKWQRPEIEARNLAHQIGLKKIKIEINNKGFEATDKEFRFAVDNVQASNFNQFMNQLDKELTGSFQKRMGFK